MRSNSAIFLPELLPHMDHGLTQIGNRQTFGFR